MNANKFLNRLGEPIRAKFSFPYKGKFISVSNLLGPKMGLSVAVFSKDEDEITLEFSSVQKAIECVDSMQDREDRKDREFSPHNRDKAGQAVEIITSGFVWENTKEGWTYWSKVVRALRRIRDSH
jgi:hypothetical protein